MGLTVAEAEEHGRKPGGPAPVQKCGHGGIRYLTWETCWVHENEHQPVALVAEELAILGPL